jgi:cytidylate kinase
MIIAIDGPAGAGKSTVARRVAQQLGFAYIDTGAMYRAVALAAHEQGLSYPDDVTTIAKLGQKLPLRFGPGGTTIFIEARDVSSEIRSPEIGSLTSQIAVLPALREKVAARQRELGLLSQASTGGAVLEGRDIQTVVFPDAELKIFLTATNEARARRRLNQWAEKGQQGDLELALRDIVERDVRDSSRETAPLKAADDAVHVLTDDLTPDQVVSAIVQLAKGRMAA